MTTAGKAERHVTVTSRHGWFSRGQEQLPRGMRQSSYADGQAAPGHAHHGRFSDGQQQSQSADNDQGEGTFADRG